MFNVLTPPNYREAITLRDVANVVLPGPGPDEFAIVPWTAAMAIAQVAAMAILFNVGAVVQALTECNASAGLGGSAADARGAGLGGSAADARSADPLWITKFVMNTVAKMILTAHPEWRDVMFTDVVTMAC